MHTRLQRLPLSFQGLLLNEGLTVRSHGRFSLECPAV